MLPSSKGAPVRVASVNVGTVDVYVIDPARPAWRVLVLQRSSGTRCPGAWETVHGHIEGEETPQQAAEREVSEETGLAIQRLYVISVQPFFLQKTQAVEMAIVFAAFVDAGDAVRLGDEHSRYEWLDVERAGARFLWPRERLALGEIRQLLSGGDAGPAEDVLRIR